MNQRVWGLFDNMQPGLQNNYYQNLMGNNTPNGFNNGGGIAGGWNSQGNGLGFNLGTAQLALGGLNSLGNLWGAFQANKMAKEQFAYQRNLANANYDNQVASYNTALADRGRSRASIENRDPSYGTQYYEANKLQNRNF